MFRRHIDFLAVLFLAVVMAAFSKASSVLLPPADVVRMQNAVNVDSCPISREVLMRLEDILNR
jgi:hypothetical protein